MPRTGLFRYRLGVRITNNFSLGHTDFEITHPVGHKWVWSWEEPSPPFKKEETQLPSRTVKAKKSSERVSKVRRGGPSPPKEVSEGWRSSRRQRTEGVGVRESSGEWRVMKLHIGCFLEIL